MQVIIIFIQILLILLIASSVKIKKKLKFWNKIEINNIRGIMALIIVLFHASYDINIIPNFLKALNNLIAIIIVAIFSFFSAYGIEKQICCKGKEYLKTIPYKMIKLLTYITIVFLIKFITGMMTFTAGILWINTLLLSYCFAFFCHLFFKDKAYIVIMIFWIIYSISMWIFPNVIFAWPHQSLLYGFGAMYYHYQDKIESFLLKNNTFSMLIILTLLIAISFICIMFYFTYGTYPNISGMMQFERCIFTICLSLVIILLAHYFVLNNKLLSFFGDISMNMFLHHGIWLDFFVNIIKLRGGALVALTFCSTVLSSTLVYICRTYLSKIQICK